MRTTQFFLFVFIFCTCSCTSREEGKESKKTKDSLLCVTDTVKIEKYNKPYALFAGKYDGKLTKSEILANKKLTISDPEIKMVSFQMSSDYAGVVVELKGQGDSLTNEMKDVMRKWFVPGRKFYFDNIKGVNASGDTIILNPISIKVIYN